MRHALINDPERYNRLRYRWAQHDIHTVKVGFQALTKVATSLAETFSNLAKSITEAFSPVISAFSDLFDVERKG